jgi:hypothetical protein
MFGTTWYINFASGQSHMNLAIDCFSLGLLDINQASKWIIQAFVFGVKHF